MQKTPTMLALEQRRKRSYLASQAGEVQDECSVGAQICKKLVHTLVVQVSKQNSLAGLAALKQKPNKKPLHLKSLAGGSLVSWCEPGCSRKETNRALRGLRIRCAGHRIVAASDTRKS